MGLHRARRMALAGAGIVMLALTGGTTRAQSFPSAAAASSTALSRYPWPVIRVTGQAYVQVSTPPGPNQRLGLSFDIAATGSSASAALLGVKRKLTQLVHALASMPQVVVTGENLNVSPLGGPYPVFPNSPPGFPIVSPLGGPYPVFPNSPPGFPMKGRSVRSAKVSRFRASASVSVEAPSSQVAQAVAAATQLRVTGFDMVGNEGGIESGPIPSAQLEQAIVRAYENGDRQARSLAGAMGMKLGPVASAVVSPVQACFKCAGLLAGTATVEVQLVYRIE